MATYYTDLTTLTTAESGTWTEFDAPYNGAGTPGADGENYIQGTDCFSQTTGKAVGLEISIVFDNGSNVSLSANDVILAWVFYAVGVNLETYSNSGWRFGIGSGTGAWDWFRIGGSDYGRNPYGGWFNVAIDPTATEDGTIGGGNGGSYRYFGSVPYTLNEISKGTPSAVDAIRYGRGILAVYGSGGSFSELAEYNDYNAGSTPPGTSSTSLDSGRHRLGLFQDIGGVYLWKGFLSFGLISNSVTFSDSNVTIIVDDCPNTYSSFNNINIYNASSSVTWTNVTIISTGTVAPGNFNMSANATVNFSGCSFNNMGTFVLQSNASINDSSFNSCGIITLGEADISGSNILTSTAGVDAGAVHDLRTSSSPASFTEYDNCTFSKGTNAHHAIRFGPNVTGDITLTGIEFTGFSGTADATDATLRFDATSGALTVYLIDCTVNGSTPTWPSGNFGIDDAAGITVTVVIAPVTVTVDAVTTDGSPVIGARVLLYAANGTGSLPYQDSVTITQPSPGGTAEVSHTGHGIATGKKVLIKGANEQEFNGVKTITVIDANTYSYDLDSPYPAGDATGTITSTGVVLEGLTDSSGQIVDSRTYGSAQPVTGWIRKGTNTPRYKDAILNGTISASADTNLSGTLVLDE